MMKTLPNNSKLVLAAAVLTVLFASGCERRTPTDTTGTTPPASEPSTTTGVSPAPTTAPESTASPSIPSTGDSKTTGTVIDDTVITTKVKTALLADSDIKGLDVNVDTVKGVVTLNGAVNNQMQIERAGKIATDTQGVSSVTNNLTIKK